MKTKKFFYALAALFCCLSLTSCGDDDDDILPAEKTITSATFYVTLNPSNEQLDVSDILLDYTDDQGADLESVVNKTPCYLKVDIKKLPVNGKFTYSCKKKEGAVIDNDAIYKMSRQVLIKIDVTYSDGKTATIRDDAQLPFNDNSQTMKGSKVEDWMTRHATLATKSISLDAKGSFSGN